MWYRKLCDTHTHAETQTVIMIFELNFMFVMVYIYFCHHANAMPQYLFTEFIV